jgi:hypothetical protein
MMSQDAIVTLNKEKSAINIDIVKTAADHFQDLTYILVDIHCCPFVWFEFENIGGSKLLERIKFNILEIQENVENFADKKELTLEVRRLMF